MHSHCHIQTYIHTLYNNIIVLENGLASNFAEVRVCVVDCPDLSLPEWNLAAPGET